MMNPGEDDNSYAKNAPIVTKIQDTVRPLIEAAAAEVMSSLPASCSGTVRIADFGCATGATAFSLATMAVTAIRAAANPPELCVFLNDTPLNDFNSVFKLLPAFLDEHSNSGSSSGGAPLGQVFVFAAPGTFYGRLFPAASLHLGCSSNSLMWLSKVPEQVAEGKLAHLNKTNIGVGRTSPPVVCEAYANQFKKDLRCFLECRADEIVPGGWLVISFLSRRREDPHDYDSSECNATADILTDLAAKGVIPEEKIHSYEVPFYQPWEGEVRGVIEEEGSFEIHHLRNAELPDEIKEDLKNPFVLAKIWRAVSETLLVEHFGAEMMEEEWMKTAIGYFSDVLNAQGSMPLPSWMYVSLRRKDYQSK